jgi:ABC-type multidrug transport system fused ATPase/permease subunit
MIFHILPTHKMFRRTNLFLALVKTFRYELACEAGYAVLWSIFMYTPPIFLNRLLKFILNQETGSMSSAYLDAAGLWIGTLLMSACLQQAAFYGQRVVVKTQAVLSGIIYEKCLHRRGHTPPPPTTNRDQTQTKETQSTPTRKTKQSSHGTGFVANLLNVDVKCVADTLGCIYLLVGCSVQVAIALTLLSLLLGWATACSIGSIIPVYLVLRYVGSKFGRVMAALLKASDKRMSIINEVSYSDIHTKHCIFIGT